MYFKKKGSLELSVNAIVVFVLAFAMLGVGLFIVNLIKDKVSGGIEGVVEIDKLKNPPSAQEPLTIEKEVAIKKYKTKNILIGFYNAGGSDVEVQVYVDKCVSSEDTSNFFEDGDPELPQIVSLPQAVKAGDPIALNVVMSLKNSEFSGLYVCTLKALDASNDDEDLGISKSFYLQANS